MGSIVTRPRVRVVVAQAALTATAAVVMTTARLIAKGATAATRAAWAAAKSRADASPAAFESTATLRETFVRAERAHLQGTQLGATADMTALKTATLAALAETPFMLDDTPTMTAHVQALEAASSLVAVRTAKMQLLGAALTAHGRIQANAVLVATERAFDRVGFTSVQRQPSLASAHRVEAQAGDGRIVVAEVGADGTLTTEILGGCGSEQEALHDKIETALESEGVRSSTRARKPTGGVATSATAKDFLRRKAAKTQTDAERSRRLNQQRALARRR